MLYYVCRVARMGGIVIRSLAEVVKGWVYLFAFITGGNYMRKAKLRGMGKGVKISPTVFFKHPEMIQIGDNSFLNHLCSVWASAAGPITSEATCCLAPAYRSSRPIMAWPVVN